MAYLAGDVLNEDALPSGPPDQQWQRDGHLYQSWNVNAGAPQVIYKLDCLYEGTKRHARFDLFGKQICLAKWQARKDGGVVPGTLEFYCR